MDDQKRLIIESILENERLTQDLDDQPASLLIKWGIAIVEQEYPVAFDPDGKQLRIFLRKINRLATSIDSKPPEALVEILQEIITIAEPFASLRKPASDEKSLLQHINSLSQTSVAANINALITLFSLPPSAIMIIPDHKSDTGACDG